MLKPPAEDVVGVVVVVRVVILSASFAIHITSLIIDSFKRLRFVWFRLKVFVLSSVALGRPCLIW